MTVRELEDELECYDGDMEVVFELNEDIEVDSWTEDRWGNKSVHVNAKLKRTFSGDVNGKCWFELGVKEQK